MLSISGLLQLILAAGYGSTVRAVRCADLVLPLRPKDDPTDKFDDAVEFVRQLVTFLEVASSARAPWAQGEFSQLAALFAAERDLKKKCVSHAQNVNGIWLQRQERRQIFCKRSTTHHTLLLFGMPQAGTRALSRDLAPKPLFQRIPIAYQFNNIQVSFWNPRNIIPMRVKPNMLDNRRLCAEGALSWRPPPLLEAENGRFPGCSHRRCQR